MDLSQDVAMPEHHRLVGSFMRSCKRLGMDPDFETCLFLAKVLMRSEVGSERYTEIAWTDSQLSIVWVSSEGRQVLIQAAKDSTNVYVEHGEVGMRKIAGDLHPENEAIGAIQDAFNYAYRYVESE
jgi:hypothetical protein